MSVALPLLADSSAAPGLDDAAPSAERAVRHVPELPVESRWKRATFLSVAIAISIAYLACVLMYWTPSHTGVDQNGYLVGGRMFAETLSMKQAPTQIGQTDTFDPHQFIGRMWVAATSNPEHFYPKYPLGLPLLYAIALWIGGPTDGVYLAHLISPIAMAATVFGVFVLTRQFAGSFPGILAMLVFATSPTTTALVNNPNSHATTVFCVVWGMICLFHWWRRGGWYWALAGGFLVGYAATIRYSEGALLLPIAWAAIINLRWRSWRGWLESGLVLVGWTIPVALLLTYNWFEMGTLTGYDATNESTGFSWDYFYDNWEIILRQLSENGLFLILPISIAGMVAMFWWRWRIAVLMWLWVGPCLTIYTFYYWAPDGVGSLRFVLTILPPMLVGGFWLMAHLRDLLPTEPLRGPAYLMVLVLTLAALAAGAVGYYGLRLDLAQLTADLKSGAGQAKTDAAAAKPGVADPEDAKPQTIQSFKTYFDEPEGSLRRQLQQTVFGSSLVMLAAWGAALSASAFLRRSVVPTLAAGVVAFLSVAVQADNSINQLEREGYNRLAMQTTFDRLRAEIPDGAVLISKDSRILHHMQFTGDFICYDGYTFDRSWVERQPRNPVNDPVLIDPVRGKQLLDQLGKYDHRALRDQAREMVSNALQNNRRVFVVETMSPDELSQVIKAKKSEGPVPDFVRRYIEPLKGRGLVGARVDWWNVPVVIEPPQPGQHRGRKDRRQRYAPVACQVWEVTRAP